MTSTAANTGTVDLEKRLEALLADGDLRHPVLRAALTQLREYRTALEARPAMPEREAIAQLEWCRTEVLSLCEAIEDDPILEKALEGGDHERGYARGQIKTAKSIRNAMAEVLRNRIAEVRGAALASSPMDAVKAAVEAEREACATIAEMHDHRGDIAQAIRARAGGAK